MESKKPTYTFEFEQFHLTTDNFKQKDANIITNMISNGRMWTKMRFNSYGHISYNDWDEGVWQYPTVEYCEEFNRNKVNCLIYDTIEHSDIYDKIFIMWTNSPHDPTFSFVFYNTTTGRKYHRWCIEGLPDMLCIALAQEFNLLDKHDLIERYSKKYDEVKTKKPRTGMVFEGCPSASDKIAQMRRAKYEKLGLNIL